MKSFLVMYAFALPACLGLTTSVQAGQGPAPPDCEVMLTLEKATWFAAEPERLRNVALRLSRRSGVWCPVFAGHSEPGQNATHCGFITSEKPSATGENLKVRLHIRPDPWIGGAAEAAYDVQFSADGQSCSGAWTGVVHGAQCRGNLTGEIEVPRLVPGFVAPAPGEHPRFLLRKGDVAALRARAETPEGREILEQLKKDKSSLAQGFVYVLTGERACADAAKAAILDRIAKNEWYHTGGATHSPAFKVSEDLMAYDLVYDACDEAVQKQVRDYAGDKLELYYWGAQNTQFNPDARSNWSLMYRSALGFMAMTAMDLPLEPVEAAQPEFPRLTPPADLKIGTGVPVQQAAADQPIGSWLFAGPVNEGPQDDPFRGAGGVAAARPQAGDEAGDCVFQALGAPSVVKGNVDLAALTARKYLKGCYLYCVVQAPQDGYYQLTSSSVKAKGLRQRAFYLSGHRMVAGGYVHLAAGKYPLMVRIFTEPVGNWEPLSFWAGLAPATEPNAQAWFALQKGAAAADAWCGKDWREQLQRKTGWNPDAWAYAQMAADKAEGYLMRSLGEAGWNQEGEAYTRHAMHLGMPFARCYLNMFGRDIRGADRLGRMLVLATATTVFSDRGARMQSYSVGGGPMDLSLFPRAFAFVPVELRPAVRWSWNRTAALCQAGKFTDPHGPVATYDTLSRVLMFMDPPADTKERNPGELLPRVTVDRQKGGYVFRNRWQDDDDCVVQLYANDGKPGGTWCGAEGGTFRIDGLGASWAVRGQAYGNGASGRQLPDYSLYQNMVDVGEQFITGSPSAKTVHFAPQEDGSGTVTLNLDEIYLHAEKEKITSGRNVSWKTTGTKDLGIRAVRSLAVDYSGKCGAPCLVVVSDRLTGTQGSNIWQMATERENTVVCSNNQFLITAKNGATLQGTVVRPAGVAVKTLDYEHQHEINYHGGHNHRIFARRAILAEGRDKDQEFLVVMTLQKGPAAEVKTVGQGNAACVEIGPRKVRCDGRKIELE